MARVVVNVPARAKRGEVIEIRTLAGHTMPSRYLRQAPMNISRTSSRDGLNIVLGLLPVVAQVADQALRAAGLAREANVAPM